ncbi:hypothetical protein Q73_16605 [Bacillus coahuilensis m2-6]|uniref:DUF4359 domain-containing protein n=1 Tax=Bacillus coahuilensis p1.1.43 TaxID=1150625 RepID=A0A147KCM8_9BACI|nr:hypothetical protein [Bacillus coahuilensis]KUP03952.1 hypothetical protein Q73_16605 [Bacillus coahuilensis m2-6]KUP09434.1 hypothetical protein Q75_00490 [Bacillus coahuilensis p1.1.43]
MKKWLIVGSLVLILLVSMYLTKPTEDRYTLWVLGVMSERIGSDQPLEELALEMFGEQLVNTNTEHADYLFFTVHSTEFKGKEMKFIGIFNTFLPIKKF